MNLTTERSKYVAGYLNLIANSVDNFTHGLAIGGSFLVSFRLGFLTTFAILVHEIPHEIGDFAILLRSGFNRWDAAKAQLITATGGIFGAFVAVIFSGDAVGNELSLCHFVYLLNNNLKCYKLIIEDLGFK
jgi:zinc transporter 13